MSTLKRALPICAIALWLLATQAQAQTTCLADFSALGQGQIKVEILQRSDGLFDAVINGVTTNAGGKVVDEEIRSTLDLSAKPDDESIGKLNTAERSLVHLYGLATNPTTRQLVKIQFSTADVRRIKTFDLIGRTDKFGGQVLLEAYGPGGELLGRMVRRVLVVSCQ